MKKYLLFAYGNFSNPIVCENLIETISSITHSDFLKFKHTDTYIYFHFATDFVYDHIHDIINASFSEVVLFTFVI